MSDVLERGMYRDPLLVLLAEEDKTCAGCKYQREALDTEYCGLGKRYGWKCKSYDEIEVVDGKS